MSKIIKLFAITKTEAFVLLGGGKPLVLTDGFGLIVG